MRRLPVALISLTGLLILGACTGRDSTAPRGIAPDLANLATTPAPATSCDFSAIKAAARNYFTSSQDTVYNDISAMQKAYGAANYTLSTSLGWKIGREVAAERLTAATRSGSAGRIFLIDVLLCIGSPSSPLALTSDFTNHADTVLDSGIWEIRGGPADSDVPAAGRVISNTSHVREFGQPRWGVEAVDSTWPGSTDYAVYGYPTNFGNFIVGSPSNINTNEHAKNSFVLGTLPDGTPKDSLRVGVCISTDNATDTTAKRIIHNGSEILDKSYLTQLCSTTIPGYVALAPTSNSWYASALNSVGRFLTPKDAFAQFDCTDCIGGLPSGWSPFGANAITASTIRLSYIMPPNDTTVSQTDTVTVRAAIDTTSMPGVAVTISISGNSGQAGGALFDNGQTFITQFTGKDGTTTFIFKIQKAGGYTLTTKGTIDGFAVGNTLSTFLNIQNK